MIKMTKQTQARYSIATITTKDVELVKRRVDVKSHGYTDEAIYRRGIEVLEAKSEAEK
jgi:hypothetical protein